MPTKRKVGTERLDVLARRTKRAIDRHVALHDVPAILMKPRYRKIGGMKLLDKDRKLAEAEMRRNFSVLARVTLLRSRKGKWPSGLRGTK